ncbi:mRNA-decapping enzyme 1A [Pseudolycoriella hygida]|uniref:mRNA-decapping enzyme 1A n=1 Tax=Pseudolycoriella hygida TaxID=35572 RepID=A0A9Q0S7Z5_9DIPT|nr:mRNA-decapping enzyme 1A [Pseudolycoriella hygida]
MSDQRELRMNIVAIKRVDPYAKNIVDSSAHVAFYTFNKEEEEWEKTDVEGAFFIYSRTAEPYHSVFINNRLNTKSLVEPITAQIELQIEAPFMLYRNERSQNVVTAGAC